MARWIDATPEMRLKQYTAPDCRKQISTGSFDAIKSEILADVDHAKARHAASDHPSRDEFLDRRLAALRKQYASVIKQEKFATWAAGQ